MPLPLLKPLLEEYDKEKVKPISIGSYWLRKGEFRLDASFYGEEAFTAERILKESRYEIKTLGEMAEEIFYPTRFKRVWTDSNNGLPFIGSSDIFVLKPPKEKFISRQKTKEFEKISVKLNWVLITRSGTVGRSVFVNQTLSKYLVSEHVIRIIPNENIFSGYLYAFTSCKFGNALLLKNIFGSTVNEIEPHHVASVPVPILPIKKQEEIHNEIVKAYGLRDEANDLLNKAEALLYEELGIKPFSEDDVKYLSSDPRVKAFSIKSCELNERFDGSYHIPVVKTVIKKLKQGKYPLVKLGEMAERIFIPPRFKRIYVSKEHGVPFLQGSHIPQMKPQDLKYISRNLSKNIENWIIKQHWVLVTCSGTIGRIAIAPSQWDNWAASQHILRLIANKEKTHAGYIAAFLSTHYGQHQLTSKIYGGVVDEITEEDTKEILIPHLPLAIQSKIGNLIIETYEKKEEANKIETTAIQKLERCLQ